MSTIYCVVGHYSNLRDAIYENRGITLSASATQRAPNAFNLIRQAAVLSRAGHGNAGQQFQDQMKKVAGMEFMINSWSDRFGVHK